MTNLVPFDQMQHMANAISSSKLFGMTTPEQALALMLVAQAEGRHPGIIARDYHIIQGKPALKADAMLARFQEAGGCIKWHEISETKADATFSHIQGGELRMHWTWADAIRAGLATKEIWKKYPRAMLRSRLISEGIRSIYPAVLCGVYTEEEVQDFTPMKDITPTSPTIEYKEVEEKIIDSATAEALTNLCFEIASSEDYDDKTLLDWIRDNQHKINTFKQVYAEKILAAMVAKKISLLSASKGKKVDETPQATA